ncbi:hypothetical protein JCM24511_06314 [Saitozyma sp. JCM 24511]|nr:hypothetical protein JCM24511_06314 [Saitozyma sp. JCM 24511]
MPIPTQTEHQHTADAPFHPNRSLLPSGGAMLQTTFPIGVIGTTIRELDPSRIEVIPQSVRLARDFCQCDRARDISNVLLQRYDAAQGPQNLDPDLGMMKKGDDQSQGQGQGEGRLTDSDRLARLHLNERSASGEIDTNIKEYFAGQNTTVVLRDLPDSYDTLVFPSQPKVIILDRSDVFVPQSVSAAARAYDLRASLADSYHAHLFDMALQIAHAIQHSMGFMLTGKGERESEIRTLKSISTLVRSGEHESWLGSKPGENSGGIVGDLGLLWEEEFLGGSLVSSSANGRVEKKEGQIDRIDRIMIRRESPSGPNPDEPQMVQVHPDHIAQIVNRQVGSPSSRYNQRPISRQSPAILWFLNDVTHWLQVQADTCDTVTQSKAAGNDGNRKTSNPYHAKPSGNEERERQEIWNGKARCGTYAFMLG